MVITKESVNARILELQQEMANADAAYNACRGAIADCNFWLKQIEIVEETKAVEPVDSIPE